jgi:uncharacterized membrane protein
MATLSTWTFDTPAGAQDALHILERLQWQRSIVVQDASVVSWPDERRRPDTYQVGDVAGCTALSGAFWGLLFGLLFLLPLADPVPGVRSGVVGLSRIGLPDDFLQRIREHVVPGTSALFLLVPDDVVDLIAEVLAGTAADELTARLTPDQDASLRRAFDVAEAGGATTTGTVPTHP